MRRLLRLPTHPRPAGTPSLGLERGTGGEFDAIFQPEPTMTPLSSYLREDAGDESALFVPVRPLLSLADGALIA